MGFGGANWHGNSKKMVWKMMFHDSPWVSMVFHGHRFGFPSCFNRFPPGDPKNTQHAVRSGGCCTCNMQRRRSCWMCTKEPGSSAGAILSWKHVVCQHTISRHFFSVTSKSLFFTLNQFPARGMFGCHSNSGGSLSQRDGRWHEHCTDVSLGSLAQHRVKTLVPREPQHI